ncbi:VOC family protein [Siphonobacter sp. SORGH_AS_0500]|uniref:bleomycin resistance protein n=1 Tax=Siphonobacter sp. SORGH_AS_0500 TaxID=1864824 RepID=UPI00285D9907|nr:VOC family protein [Siphonobacter sp. SORGH_AS_0500]MDR6195296.1 catechol 2,3-dioxygenase-like lactoylglutathione lyase family enzyme [Siphonobacter sp. SORGH_AS_0500]
MLTTVHPKLPMRDKAVTKEFYMHLLGFTSVGKMDYDGYLMLEKDLVQIHFFEFKALDPAENYGQVYIRTDTIQEWYEYLLAKKVKCMPLATKPWGQKEFSLLDPDHNLLTFGQES